MKPAVKLTIAAAALAAAYAGAAQAAETLATTLPAIVASGTAAYAGKPDANQVLELVVSLPLRNQAALTEFLADLENPASAQFRHYLSVGEFAERFGPSAADYQTAVDFFRDAGLSVTNTWAHRQTISLSARVADVERVFHVQMGLYSHPLEHRLFFAADRQPTLDLGVAVNQVIGLDNYVLPHPKNLLHASAAGPRTGSGPGGQFDGNDIHTAYYPSGTLTGAGQSVGLMELAGLNVSDVSLFFSKGYGPANSVPIKLIKAGSIPVTCGSACGDDSEQALDVEYAIAVAPGLASVRVYVAGVAEQVLSAMAADNISKELSTSWGWNENKATDEGLFEEFEAQGQTNLTASGDYSSLSASGPWPEEDTYITGVGGTDLSMSGSGAAWSGETGWSGSAGGPSTDHSIATPSYQLPYVTTANGGSKLYRNVPDVAASANTNMEICANGGCSGGNGGTSFASPIWAGFIALVNQKAVNSGKPVVGFINPFLYGTLGSAANYATIFHDEKTGKSGKFSCEASYDLVTGFGSPAGAKLVSAFLP